MTSIIKVNTIQDGGGNAIITSDGSGNITTQNVAANTPFFEAIMSANQTVSDATDTKVQFDTENFDTNSAYDHSTNYRFTVPSGEAGKYFIYVVLNNASNTNSDLLLGYVYLYKNGSAVRVSHENATSNGGRSFNLNMNLVLDLSVGDYLEVFARTDVSSGTPRFTAEVGAGKISTFGAYKLIGV